MKKRNLAFMIPISMLSLGCSTDDVANIITGEEAVTLSGKVIDGYISGANVFIDLNNNGEFDSGEPFAMSDENGTYTIETDLESGDFQVIAEGGVDIVTGETFDGTLRTVFNRDESNISGIVISPVTTLVAEEFSLNRDDGLTGAKDKIATNFKIDPKDIDRDFIKDENFDLFTLNQNIINEVERLSIYAEESNSSDDYTRSAIQTILETSSFDQTTNIEKLSEKLAVTIARNSDTSLDGEEAMAPSSELDSNQTVDDRFEV